MLSGQRVEHLETVRVAKDGRRIDVSVTVSPVKDQDGQIVGASKIVHDITDRKRAEKALHESETLLRAVTEGSPDPIFLKDRDSRILLANAATCAAMGKPAEQIIGKTDAEVYADPAVGRAVMENDSRVMESGQTLIVEEVVPGPDCPRTFLSTKTPYRDPDGRVVGIVGVARDITDRKGAEEVLRESRAKLKAAFASMTEAIFIADAEGRLLDFNEGFVRYHRFRDREECSRTIADCPRYLDAYFQDGAPAPPEMWAMPPLSGRNGIRCRVHAAPQGFRRDLVGQLRLCADQGRERQDRRRGRGLPAKSPTASGPRRRRARARSGCGYWATTCPIAPCTSMSTRPTAVSASSISARASNA